eukprot:SAG22_NODE_504_length_9692_cov_366.074325_3_plen_197_part_00
MVWMMPILDICGDKKINRRRLTDRHIETHSLPALPASCLARFLHSPCPFAPSRVLFYAPPGVCRHETSALSRQPFAGCATMDLSVDLPVLEGSWTDAISLLLVPLLPLLPLPKRVYGLHGERRAPDRPTPPRVRSRCLRAMSKKRRYLMTLPIRRSADFGVVLLQVRRSPSCDLVCCRCRSGGAVASDLGAPNQTL